MPHSHYLVKNIHFFNNGKNIKSCTHVLPNPFKFSTQHISLNSCTSSLVASYWANLWRTAELHFKKRRIFNESQRSVKLADNRSVPISLKARLSQRKAESRSIMAKNCFFFCPLHSTDNINKDLSMPLPTYFPCSEKETGNGYFFLPGKTNTNTH